ncbi:hypothetical protein IFM89_032952 [Coptis chinensis]|uniref:F-box domain-containing protein n=1 Tax=Coptis chinensis TaxID=261450 RepID=A0A835I7H3_9MAGN|nr:hypothetical protein IFM89_032952 [Coptis chinensis]
MSLCSSVHTGTKRRTLEFPRDIIHDIFSRLPFKSVLRLKCACKSWYFLLKDPDFVIMHLNESMKRKDDNFSFMICNFKHFLVDYDTSSAKLLKAFWVGEHTCLYDYKERHSILVFMAFYLWNPSTKAYRELPEAFSKYQSKYFNVVYGFGYESAHDEYKVIRIRFSNGRPHEYGGIFLNGAIHWLGTLDVNAQDVQVDYAM